MGLSFVDKFYPFWWLQLGGNICMRYVLMDGTMFPYSWKCLFNEVRDFSILKVTWVTQVTGLLLSSVNNSTFLTSWKLPGQLLPFWFEAQKEFELWFYYLNLFLVNISLRQSFVFILVWFLERFGKKDKRKNLFVLWMFCIFCLLIVLLKCKKETLFNLTFFITTEKISNFKFLSIPQFWVNLFSKR